VRGSNVASTSLGQLFRRSSTQIEGGEGVSFLAPSDPACVATIQVLRGPAGTYLSQLWPREAAHD
jgi:hypothetical protein